MKRYDYECAKGHQFEELGDWDQEEIPCPKCKGKNMAERIWISKNSGYRHMTTPIVVDRLPDGSYSFPGDRKSKPPAGAERIEMKTHADYRREMKKVNEHFKSKTEMDREALHRNHEIILDAYRKEARQLMNEIDDPWAKDFIRSALEQYNTNKPTSSFGEIWNEIMEN